MLRALLVVALTLPARAGTGETVLPEESRWLSFVRLVEARWDERVRVPPEDRTERADLFATCIDDAWYLARPTMVTGPASACHRLVDGLAVDKAAQKTTGTRKDWRARVTRQADAFGITGFRTCAQDAAARGDGRLIEICAETLRSRASVVASLPDDDRFRIWMTGCKRAMLGPVEPPPATTEGAPAAPPPPVPDADEHARHCLRTLPTLYEVQWMRRLSDFWTPEEQRLLYLRTRQLTEQ